MTTTTFSAGWFTIDRLQAIFRAPVAGAAGAAERIALIEELREQAKAVFAGSARAIDSEITLDNAMLKAWATGAIAGWNQEQIAMQSGMIPMSDAHRAILKASCEALLCKKALGKAIPEMDASDFEPDVDPSLELDEE